MKKVLILVMLSAILFSILYFAIPVKGYIDIESMHWYATIDILQYRPVKEEKWGKEEFDTKYEFLTFKERVPTQYMLNIDIPDGAYNVKWELKEYNTIGDRTTYKFFYKYNMNRWVKVSELSKCGVNKKPVEPDCDLPTSIQNPKVLDKIRQVGCHERYTVTGVDHGKTITLDIPKDVFMSITREDEFEYKKYRFGKDAFDIKVAK